MYMYLQLTLNTKNVELRILVKAVPLSLFPSYATLQPL